MERMSTVKVSTSPWNPNGLEKNIWEGEAFESPKLACVCESHCKWRVCVQVLGGWW